MQGEASSRAFEECEWRLRQAVATAQSFDPERVADAVIWRLGLAPDDAVLEFGCGSGRTLVRVAAHVPRGRLAAVESSAVMLRHARMRARGLEGSGRLRLVHGSTGDLSVFPEGVFDKAFGIHVVALWRDPGRHLQELRRTLRPGGRLLLGYRPAGESAGRGSEFPVARLEDLLDDNGFREVRTERTIEAGRLLAFSTATC